ncbi:MAG: DUF1287 domain-containing protein [Alphaproteobacteria bacterium]
MMASAFRPLFLLPALCALMLVPARADEAERAAKLVAAAIERTKHPVVYDGSYRRIEYPGGDVPGHIGVCTDLVIRAYRKALGIDLQKRVHEDMKKYFGDYPKDWGLTRPDPNIDHRRVPNLETFFKHQGAALPVSRDGHDYRAGDLVTWRLNGSLPHIGVVTHKRSGDGKRPLIAHNIGAGPRLEDMLFDHPITGHYRWLPE